MTKILSPIAWLAFALALGLGACTTAVYRDYNVGDCLSYDMTPSAPPQPHVVDCNDAVGSVVGVFDLGSVLEANPSDRAMALIGGARCPTTTTTRLFAPTNDEWAGGWRQLLCVADR